MMLQPVGEGIWIVDGPKIVAALGFHYPTRMVIVRLSNGSLWIWSPTALTDGLLAAVSAIGPVRHLVAPNSLHHMALSDWLRACPGAIVHGAPGLEAKREDISFASTLGDQPHADWAGTIDQVVIQGNRITTEAVFFHRPSQTVLVTDLIQQLPPGWFSGWRALVARADLMMEALPTVPRKFRLAFADKAAARQSLRTVLGWDCQQLICAHSSVVRQDARAVLSRAFAFLKV